MGSITHINHNPQSWKVSDENLKLKQKFGGDKLLKIVYGDHDDYPGGQNDLEMFMRESIYNRLLSDELRVSHHYSDRLVIFDKNNQEVKKINDSIF